MQFWELLLRSGVYSTPFSLGRLFEQMSLFFGVSRPAPCFLLFIPVVLTPVLGDQLTPFLFHFVPVSMYSCNEFKPVSPVDAIR